MLLPELRAACRANPDRVIDETREPEEACAVLTNWDRHFNSESRGAVLFREWITRYHYDETYLGRRFSRTTSTQLRPLPRPRGSLIRTQR